MIPILQKAQDVYGFLPAEVLQWIADRLGIALGKVYTRRPSANGYASRAWLVPRESRRLKTLRKRVWPPISNPG